MIHKDKPNTWTREFPIGGRNDEHVITTSSKGVEIDYDTMTWKQLLGDLTDDERCDIFHEFCTCCGSATLPCYCMRDD